VDRFQCGISDTEVIISGHRLCFNTMSEWHSSTKISKAYDKIMIIIYGPRSVSHPPGSFAEKIPSAL
ncbi:MAG: hypothetical protein PVG67_05305, partial [Desulfobacterales bacterium]